MNVSSIRVPAVAGTFYPAAADRLDALVKSELHDLPREPASIAGRNVVGLLVPHAGLAYSGRVAASAWRLLGRDRSPATIVMLGTNHSAFLDGVGAWDRGAWQTPLGGVSIDGGIAEAIVELGPPFVVDRAAHLAEHSIEVQLPFLREVVPQAELVPLAVSAGIGERALDAGKRLGRLIAMWRRSGERVLLAISSDMAHYPPADVCSQSTEFLLPQIVAIDPRRLAEAEGSLRTSPTLGLLCGMCGIEPAVLGLAALAELGVEAIPIMSATSADAGGDPGRTVGYLSVAFVEKGTPSGDR